MKVKAVTCFPVHPGWRKNWVYVKVETDDGVVGWGEAYSQYDRDRAVTAHVEELGRYLIGRDPFQIKHFTQIAFDDYAQRRGSLEFYSAVSGIETAMWDICGKALNQPVYNLLGGPVRDKIRVYANGWYYKMTSAKDYAKAAEKVVKDGFDAIKMDPVTGPWRNHISREQEDYSVEILGTVRKAVGPNVDILLDLHRRLAPSLIRIISKSPACGKTSMPWPKSAPRSACLWSPVRQFTPKPACDRCWMRWQPIFSMSISRALAEY
jgi:galactonate dehydratase